MLDDLPAKVERTEFCSMTESQLQCYTAAVARAKENRGMYVCVRARAKNIMVVLDLATFKAILSLQCFTWCVPNCHYCLKFVVERNRFAGACCLRPYHAEYTSSRPITEVKPAQYLDG